MALWMDRLRLRVAMQYGQEATHDWQSEESFSEEIVPKDGKEQKQEGTRALFHV